MLVDSHCHLDMLDLAPFGGSIDGVLAAAQEQGVEDFLCVSINMEDYPAMLKIAETHQQVMASVGLHPNERGGHEPETFAVKVTWTGSATVFAGILRLQGNQGSR
jgi:TatD DNase family protein